jgi:hypothetical protein
MSYLVSASAAFGLFVAAGWRSRQAVGATALFSRSQLGMHVILPDGVPDPATGQHPRDDVSIAIYLALARLAAVIARQSVKVDVAVRPGLQVRTRGPVLADTLEELLTVALQAAPASQLLLTAVADADHVDIAISDDMPGGDAAVRYSHVGTLTERLRIRGDSLLIDVRPSEGTTMTLRLARSIGTA